MGIEWGMCRTENMISFDSDTTLEAELEKRYNHAGDKITLALVIMPARNPRFYR